MCRLYGFRATHPTRVQCELIEAQNSLMRQSRRDGRGLGNMDGWGLGTVRDGTLRCEREVGPAYESEEYRRDAARVDATTVLAHVRRATVGDPREVNTHPFRREGSLLAHNGHVPAFDRVRPRILERMAPELERGIRGTTDSEHVFHLLLSRLRDRVEPAADEPVAEAGPGAEAMADVLHGTIGELREWCGEAVGEADGIPRGPDGHRLDRLALNLLWTAGHSLAGSRFGRSLWYVEREGAHRCEVCGEQHPDPEPDGYRSVVVASERITDENWQEVPESSVFFVDDRMRLRTRPL
ncbi:MAG: class II glutamine amidotransferase [Candidatus Palauibacterales bacterium]|nr:class II glutamine amidotransferase [Candidatus Palauibacterales bacterium]